MTEILQLDEWAADTRPVKLGIGGKTFRALPISFDDAQHVNARIAEIKEPTAEDLIEITISALRFDGWDRLQRWRLRRRLGKLNGIQRQIAATRLTNLFTDALRGHHHELQRQLAALGAEQG